MNRSFFNVNKAALFREWRVSRSWFLGIAALSLVGPIVNLVEALYYAGQDGAAKSVFWYALVPAIYGIHFPSSGGLASPAAFHAYSDPAVSGVWIFLTVLLGVIPWTTDRASGALFTAFTTPLTRKDIILPKLGFGMGIVLGVQILRGASISALNAWGRAPVSWHVVAVWWITTTLCMLVAFATTLLISSVVTFWLPTVFLALGALFSPFAVGTFVDKVAGYTSFAPPFGASIGGPSLPAPSPDRLQWLKALSPLKLIGTSTGTSMTNSPSGVQTVHIEFDSGAHYAFMAGWVWAIWILWLGAATILAIRVFRSTPLENMNLFFVYPPMWKWLMGILSLLVGYILAVATHGTPVQGLSFLADTAGYSLLIFLVLWFSIRAYHRWSR